MRMYLTFSCQAISEIKTTKNEKKKKFIFKIFLATLIERRWNIKPSDLTLIWYIYEDLKKLWKWNNCILLENNFVL